MALALTAVHHGAVMANHVEVTGLHKKKVEGKVDQICGASLKDVLTGETWDVKCKVSSSFDSEIPKSIRAVTHLSLLSSPSTSSCLSPSGCHQRHWTILRCSS